MIGLRSSYKRKLYNENSKKNPKNELDGGSTYAIGRKVFINKAYESLESINLPANNSSNNSRKINRLKYESGANPKPLNNFSCGMRTQMLKLNTIGRSSLSYKNKKESVFVEIDNYDELVNIFNDSNSLTEDELFDGIILDNINNLLSTNNINKRISDSLKSKINKYIYPWI